MNIKEKEQMSYYESLQKYYQETEVAEVFIKNKEIKPKGYVWGLDW